jgi:hypothetical protein
MVRGVKNKEEEKVEEQNAEVPQVTIDNTKKIVSVR